MHGFGGLFAAVAAAFVGAVASVGAVMAEVGGGDFGPWVSGGGAAAAVGGLAYVVKKFASGEVVAFPVAEVLKRSEERDQKVEEMMRRTNARDDRMEELIEDCKDREDGYRAWLLGRKVADQ